MHVRPCVLKFLSQSAEEFRYSSYNFIAGVKVCSPLNNQTKLHGKKKTKTLINYLPQKSFISIASSLNGGKIAQIIEQLTLSSFSSLDLDKKIIDEYFQSLNEIYDAMGDQQAGGVQLDIDFQKVIDLRYAHTKPEKS